MSEIILGLGFAFVTILWVYTDHQKDKRHRAERAGELDLWNRERQQLLDRIQAPSYDHLKHHEVRIIKAQNNEKEPPRLEQL